MTNLKQQFKHYSTEYLIGLRAKGPDLSDAAHQAIEEIFIERGEILPPRPKASIKINNKKLSGNKLLNIPLLIIGAMALSGVSHALVGTPLGVSLAIGGIVGYGLFYTINILKRRSMTEQERKVEDEARVAEEKGLNDLMLAAAHGDLVRARELIDYGVDVNAKSNIGTTALMYAARNNKMEVLKMLLEAGANPNIKSHGGRTALDYAVQHASDDIQDILRGRIK